MTLVFRHQDDEDGGNHQEGSGGEPGSLEGGQAAPGGVRDGLKGARGQNAAGRGQDVSHHSAQQNGDEPQKTLEVNGNDGRRQKRGDRDQQLQDVPPGVQGEIRVDGIGHGRRGQIQADDGHDGACDDGGHETVHPPETPSHGGQPGEGVENGGAGNAEKGVGDIVRLTGGDGQDRTDEGKAGAQVAGHLETRDGDKNQGVDSGKEQGHLGMESHEEGGQHRGAEHGHHVLEAQGDEFGDGDFVFGVVYFLFGHEAL